MSATNPISYPVDPPLPSLREVVRIVRAGDLVVERAALAKHGWITQGFLQKLAFGEGPAPIGAAPDGPYAIADEAACDALQELAADDDPQLVRSLPIPAQALLAWLVRLLLERALCDG